ncbi:MAG TPA: hypothetical protein PK109_02185 [Candidatus Paceibacterota bacterium]|nr:hypothetical protein [Candidatus Paceibacterota bacterium]
MSDSIPTKIRSFISSHKKLTYWVGGGILVILILIVGLFATANFVVTSTPERSDDVASFMHRFETAIPLVPLGGTPEEVAAAIDANYTPFVSPELLAAWKADPANALGDPAGDATYAGMRVKSIRNVGVLSYIVKAYLQERTPVTIPGLGSGTAKRDVPVTFGVSWKGNSWKITEYALGHGTDDEAATTTPVQ